MKNLKANWKKHLIARLKIVGFILVLVGWFLIITIFLENFLKKDLSSLETFVETNTFKIGIRLFVIIFLIILFKNQTKINNLLEKHKKLKIFLKIIFIGGLIGWLIGLSSLMFF